MFGPTLCHSRLPARTFLRQEKSEVTLDSFMKFKWIFGISAVYGQGV